MRYFDTLAAAASSGLFDSLSHPDLVKIFGERAASFDYAPVADAIAAGGVAVEVSTAGLRKPVGELYPHPEFLAACRGRGVPVTLGSDAHSPDVVGRDFDRARELMRSAGYETVTIFERRQARQEPLG
jgi:histidinol-phosphatase (PHP family)